MVKMLERAQAIDEHAREVAEAALLDGIAAPEAVTRARVAAEAGNDVATLRRLLAARPRGPVLADLLRSMFDHDDDAGRRVTRAREVELVARAWQTTDDNPGLLSARTPAGLPIPSQPTPFLEAFAMPVGEEAVGSRELSIPDVWRPKPMGTVDPVPESGPVAPLGSHTAALSTPWHYALATVNVSRQALRWSVGEVAEWEGLVRSATDNALEAALIADLLGAAPPAAGTPTDDAAAIDAAESAAATGWGSDATHLLCNPGDGPAVRRAQALRDPTEVLAVASVPAGTVVAVCSSAVVCHATVAEVEGMDEPSVVGKLVGATRFGAVLLRDPAAAATVTLP
jgi:hypothetical protein